MDCSSAYFIKLLMKGIAYNIAKGFMCYFVFNMKKGLKKKITKHLPFHTFISYLTCYNFVEKKVLKMQDFYILALIYGGNFSTNSRFTG